MLRSLVSALAFGVLLSAQLQAAPADKADAKPAKDVEEFKGEVKEYDEEKMILKVKVGDDVREIKVTDKTMFVMPMLGEMKFDPKAHGKMLKSSVGQKEAKFTFKAKKGDKEWTLESLALEIPEDGKKPGLPFQPVGPGVKPVRVQPAPGQPAIQIKPVQVQPAPGQPAAPAPVDR